MGDSIRKALPWPIFTIDFEASSLGPGSYPIEVGVCRWAAPDVAIEGWSTLIRPVPLWRETGSWTEEAQAVHGIRREELEDGLDPAETLSILNWIVGPHAAFCDGGESDFGWARRLVLAAKFMNTFRLGDFDMLAGRCDVDGHAGLIRYLGTAPAPHRAREDAERLMLALANGFGLQPGVTSLQTGTDPTSTMLARSSQPEPGSTAIGIAIERELSEAARLHKSDRDDPRIREAFARVNELSTMRMNLSVA